METFSIILTHYNQNEFINEALDSVFYQDYKHIQLIIIDDCSKSFNKKKIEDYIVKNQKKNIDNYIILKNEKNIGTVKTLNKALKQASGNYVLIFAADDKLYDSHVLTHFVDHFNKNPEISVLTSQAYMCGQKLIVDDETKRFVDIKKAKKYNKKSANKQFYYLAGGCLFVSGATAYRNELFKKIGNYDESFILAEDWAYWLKVNLSGEKIKYVDFISLLHRDGGVSHSNQNDISESSKLFYMDDLKVYTNIIIPRFKDKQFSFIRKGQIFNKYLWYLDYYEKFIPDVKKKNEQYTKLGVELFNYYKYQKLVKMKKVLNKLRFKK